MSHAPIRGIRACVFDAYGTLFDVAAAARSCGGELGEKSSALSSLWREKQLQYTWLRALQGRHADFWQVTGEVQATLKTRIGADISKYRILGFCNPRFAHEALKLEDKLGALLLCNVIVRETADGSIEVAAVDPVSTMERTGNPALRATAEVVHGLFCDAISAVGT